MGLAPLELVSTTWSWESNRLLLEHCFWPAHERTGVGLGEYHQESLIIVWKFGFDRQRVPTFGQDGQRLGRRRAAFTVEIKCPPPSSASIRSRAQVSGKPTWATSQKQMAWSSYTSLYNKERFSRGL